MGHKIAEAILENGKLTYINKKLPAGKIKVHIVYDTSEEVVVQDEKRQIIRETSGLYKNIDVQVESAKLRNEWERHVSN